METIFKRFLCILVLLTIAGIFSERLAAQDTVNQALGTPSYLKFASWNIRIFSNSRSDDELRAICRVAKNFDFISILELRDEQVLQRMVAMLKSEFRRSYSYDLSPYVGFADEDRSSRELCAFLYNNTFIQRIGTGRLYNDSAFFRKPYYNTFRAGTFDFTVVAIHVIWGDSVEARRKEIQKLAEMYRTIQNADAGENDIILVGDFNRDPDDDLAWGPLKAISSMVHLFDLPEKSMIWDTHLYDNIWFQSCYTREYNLNRGITRFDETDFDDDDEAASLAVSDHRPVWSSFTITGTDDD